MNTHIVHNTGNIASRFPQRSFQFAPSHSYHHPHRSNENIAGNRNVAIWPARSRQSRPVIGLYSGSGGKPLPPGYTDV
jgi:hypothetical protein